MKEFGRYIWNGFGLLGLFALLGAINGEVQTKGIQAIALIIFGIIGLIGIIALIMYLFKK